MEVELGRWLKPFLEQLGHKARRRMCPLYVAGLIGPGDRKSVQPMAQRLAPGDYDQLHHFVAAGVWDAAPLEKQLLVQADKLGGRSDAVLVFRRIITSLIIGASPMRTLARRRVGSLRRSDTSAVEAQADVARRS